MREVKKIAKNVKRLITLLDNVFAKLIAVENAQTTEVSMRHAYKRIIETLYKGSIKESSAVRRFRERFKCDILNAIFIVHKRYAEVI